MTLRLLCVRVHNVVGSSIRGLGYGRNLVALGRIPSTDVAPMRIHDFRQYSSEWSTEVTPVSALTTEGSLSLSESDSGQVLPDNLYKSIDLELLGYEPAVLESYEWFLLTSASHLGIEVGNVFTPRKSDKFRFPLLKSAHVHKKHKVQYEVRTYHKFITLKKLTGSTASTYLEYVQRNLPEGIGMKVSKLEVLPKPDYVSGSTVK